jgi:hypothetical protein
MEVPRTMTTLREDEDTAATGPTKHLLPVQKQIRFQLLIFAVIFLIIAVLEIERVIRQDLTIAPILAGFLVGILIGVGLARTKVLGWDPESGKVVGTMDLIGGLILVLYIVFILMRDDLIEHWITDPALVGAIGLATTGGVMLSRVIFTRKGIRNTLEAAGVMRTPDSR